MKSASLTVHHDMLQYQCLEHLDLATQTSSPDTDKIMSFYTPCFTIEKKGEIVSFSCVKFYAQNMPECRILCLIFRPPPILGGLFKFKSDLFN
jgi:hypothetical protein